MTFRLFFPNQFTADEIVGPVDAASPAEALAKLDNGKQNPDNLQVFANGRWEWVR